MVDESGKATKQMTLFKKSFKDIGKDLKSGLGIRSFTSIVTGNDIKQLNKFNDAIRNGGNYTQAFEKHLSKTPRVVREQANELIKLNNQILKAKKNYASGNISQKEYRTQMNSLNSEVRRVIVSTEALTAKQKVAAAASKALAVAANVARTALNMLVNVGIGLAINGIITWISDLVNSEQKAIEKSKELAQTYDSTVQTLDGYKKKYLDIVDSSESESEKTKRLTELRFE